MTTEGRFSDAFSDFPSKIENEVIAHGEHAIVLPTLGMIVPNWFLIIPQAHSINFAQQSSEVHKELPAIVSSIFDLVSKPGDEVLIFEHGALRVGSNIGCGVDHAHLHVIVANSKFISKAWGGIESEMGARQSACNVVDMYSSINNSEPYYFAWRAGRMLLEQPATKEISQRLRRVIAFAAGVPDEWNYRDHPFYNNIASTIANFHIRKRLAA
ncbi:hypothetical protein NKI77_13555 [Mesorhizobium opportunistum]|uniref:Histidine triad (HIT) protein n=1 Tax=Mesorhizobium opportunistum TaxID=593909 RepID=A0ABV1YKU2_9HYPH|nr:hypothetical protein [Mesorhizobium sp.]TIN93397.1 MAG: hypothetical protein E5Y06_19270 [Mesorhizobium sp.]TJU96639.1 MAG: hypothetical protein E5Y08_21505 [Mesorhizobium sp.]TJV15692.1 MAG: hypothetical protein E5Y07_20435 [Mesorhizobium sp.]